MMRCEHCQPLILDHLYGLLDGPEAAAVESHLRDCAVCAAARDEAGRVQGLIARAAKKAFPQVRFNPAAKQPKSQVLPFPQPTARAAEPASRTSRTAAGRAARVAVWLPWAVAAAVLLAIPGTVVPVLDVLDRAHATRTNAMAAVAQADQADQETKAAEQAANQHRDRALRTLADARQAHDGLVTRWLADERLALQAANDRGRMAIDVRKPAAVQPGAPNDFLVAVFSQGNSARGTIYAEVRDQTDAVIHSQKLDVERRGETPIRLPAGAWTKLTPQSELFLVVASVDEKTGAKTELQDKIKLSGPVFATMLTTDKPSYRPGETVFFRSLTLDRVTFRPPAREQLFHYELLCSNKVPLRGLAVTGGTDLVRVVDGKVEPVRGPDGKPVRGVGTGAFPLPADLDDGDYTLVLHELPHPAGYPPAVPFPVTRPLKVQSGPADVYQKVIRFAGAGAYLPGDTVEAWAEIKLEDKPVPGAAVQVLVTADGRPVEAFPLAPATGPDGRVNVRFTLPRALDRADVRMKVTYHARRGDELREESVATQVPVVGRNLVVEFFPEGGNLVAGVPCRVYFRATTPAGVPVDIRGVITDGRTDLARVETVTDPALPGANRGIGSFTYTPALGVPVWLKLDGGVFTPLLDGAFPVAPAAVAGAPAVAAVRTRFALPAPQFEGVVMTVPDPVTAPGEPIRVHLRSVGKERNLVVGAYTRGRLSDTQKATAKPDELTEVRLMANPDPRGGVVRITVFEEPPEPEGQPRPDLKPLAERLVFRRPGELLNLTFTTAGTRAGPDAGGFVAGTPAELNVTATNEKGEPAAAILWAAVVNSGVAPGPKDRLLTTHFLLSGEISTPDAMEFADFLLTDHPKASESLDLVLATQGWRRFTEQTPAPLTRWAPPATPEHAALQACLGQYGTKAEPPGAREHRRLYEVYRPLYEAAKQNLDAAEAETAAALADRAGEERAREAAARAEQARQLAAAVTEQADTAAEPLHRFQRAGWYGVAGFGLLAVLLGVVCLGRPVSRLPLGIGTAGSLALVAFLVFALGKADTAQAGDPVPQQVKQPTATVPPAPQTPPVPPLVADDKKREPVWVAPEPRPAGTAQEMVKVATPDFPPPPGGTGGGGKGTGAKGGGKGGGFGSGPPAGGVVTGVQPGGGVGGSTAPAGVEPPNLGPKKDDPMPPPKIAPGGGLGGTTAPPGSGAFVGGGKGPKGGWPGGPPPTDLLRPGGMPAPGAPVPGMSGGPVYPLGGGWQVTNVIADDDLRDRDRKAVPPGRPEAKSAGGRAAPTQTAAAPNRLEMYHQDVQIVQLHNQQQANAAVRQMYLAFARKHSIPVEQVEQQFGMVFGGAAANDAAVGFPRPPKPPGVPTRGKAQDAGNEAPAPPDVHAFYRVQVAVAPPTPLVVREYAAPRPGGTEAGYEQNDTILWQPVIVLPADGKAKLSFTLGAAEGGYQVIVAGHTLDGRLGAVRGPIPVAPSGQTGQPALPNPVPPRMP